MIAAFVVAIAATAAVRAQGQPVPGRPNIILVLMDDLGWNDAGYLGRKYIHTPNMDRLAAEGMVFTNAYANSSECSPSRASIITGQYTPRHHLYHVKNPKIPSPEKATSKLIPVHNRGGLQGEFTLLPRPLKQAGYRTAFFGKWHHGPRPEAGKGDWDAVNANYGNKETAHIDPKRVFTNTRLGIEFMKTAGDQPFFLYISHHAPHWPFESRPATLARLEKRKKSLGKDRPDYAAMVEDADEGLGELLQAIDELGIRDNTVLLFFSDNGGSQQYTHNGPLRSGKGRPYEGGIRVPMVVRWPARVKAGSSCDTPVVGTDFYPTFLDVAGAEAPKGHVLDGVSLLPLLAGERAYTDRALFWHCPCYNTFRVPPHSVVRKGDYKLIHWYEDDRAELFNLKSDIGERTNLAETEPAKLAELQEELGDWLKSVGGLKPEPNPRYKAGD